MQRQQLASGFPVTTGAAPGTVSVTRYLNDLRALPKNGCEAAASTGSVPQSAVLDLEAKTGIPPTALFPDVSQGASNMCSSMAFAHGYSLRHALQHGTAPPPPSPVFAYYFQRIQECRAADGKVCACPACVSTSKGCSPCDPPCLDCGSYLRSAIEVFGAGVPPLSAWPSSAGINTAPTSAALTAAVLVVSKTACVASTDIVGMLALGAPVVLFLNLDPGQVAWMQAQAAGSAAEALTDVQARLPPTAASGSSSVKRVGHCVLACGCTDTLLLCRNSFGMLWGVNGRFSIALTEVTAPGSALLHSAVAVQDVVKHDDA